MYQHISETLKYNRKLIKSSLTHLTLQQLKVQLIWQAGTNSRAFHTILAVQEVRFLLPRTQNIKSFLITCHHTGNSTENSQLSF